MLEILCQDEWIVAINKPNGLAVHRSKMVRNTNKFALQQLRDQLGQRVSPIHRLDRKTSGVLLFSKKDECTALFQENLQQAKRKEYCAIVRGWFPDQITVNHPLINDSGTHQEAVTQFHLIEHSEIPVSQGNFSTSRYSLIQAFPKTGRMHQIRKHLNHLRHPIIGDRPHGCNKQNKLFKERWNMTSMLLHARSLHFTHPILNEQICIEASFPAEFIRMHQELGFTQTITL